MVLKIHNCKFVVFNSEACRIVISASQIQIELLGYSMKKNTESIFYSFIDKYLMSVYYEPGATPPGAVATTR